MSCAIWPSAIFPECLPDMATTTVTTSTQAVFDISRYSLAAQTQWRETLAGFEAIRQKQSPHIVVFGEGSFGDVLQISPLLHHLRRRFPGALMTFVHPAGLAQSLLRGSPDVDNVMILRGALHREARLRLLQQGWADLVVQCSYVIRYTMPPVRLSRLTEQQRNWVLHAQVEQKKWLPLVKDFPFDNDSLWRAVTAKNLNLFSLMARTSGFADADFELFHVGLQDADFDSAEKLPERYVTLCNAAEKLPVTEGLWTKTMPADKVERIVARIKDAGLTIVVLGAKDDAPIRGVDIDLRGKTSLTEAAAIVKKALCHIGPEGGLANIARAVNTPAIIFFGATPAAFFGFHGNVNVLPRTCGGCWWTTPYYLHQCPRLLREPECTASLSEDEIVAAVSSLAALRQASRQRLTNAQADRLAGESSDNGLLELAGKRHEDFAEQLAGAVLQGAKKLALVAVDRGSLRISIDAIRNIASLGHFKISLFVCGEESLRAETGTAEAKSLDADLTICRPQNIPARDGAFDAVLCAALPCSQRTASLLIEECNRILAPGGLFYRYSVVLIENGEVRDAYVQNVAMPRLTAHEITPAFALLRTRIGGRVLAEQQEDA